MKSNFYTGSKCDVNKLCCSGLMKDCSKIVNYTPSLCLVSVMAAFWNSGRDVLGAKDKISHLKGKENFPNASANALWAMHFFKYMNELVK